MDRERLRRLAVPLGVGAFLIALYLTLPPFRVLVQRVILLLARADIREVKEYLRGFGPWAAVVSGLLMVFQSVAAPLPAFVITFANGLLFGAWWGTLLSWSSAMAGATVCFAISRLLGRPVVEKLVGGKSLELSDRFFQRYGRHAVLLARLIPVISFDVVSYAAGLTSMGVGEFLLATGVGQLPATIVYSVLGQEMTHSARIGLWAVVGVLGLLVLALALKSYFEGRMSAGGGASVEGSVGSNS